MVGGSLRVHISEDEAVISSAGTNQWKGWSSNVSASMGMGAFKMTEALTFALDVISKPLD